MRERQRDFEEFLVNKLDIQSSRTKTKNQKIYVRFNNQLINNTSALR